MRGLKVGWSWSPNKFPNAKRSKSLGHPTVYYYCNHNPPLKSQENCSNIYKLDGRFWRSYNRTPHPSGCSRKAVCRIGACIPAALQRSLTTPWQNFSVFHPRQLPPVQGSKNSSTRKIRPGNWMLSSAPCTTSQRRTLASNPVLELAPNVKRLHRLRKSADRFRKLRSI